MYGGRFEELFSNTKPLPGNVFTRSFSVYNFTREEDTFVRNVFKLDV